MSTCFAISLLCLPDAEALRRLYRLPEDLPDTEIVEFACHRQRALGMGDVLPAWLQKIVHVGGVIRGKQGLELLSISGSELEILQTLNAHVADSEDFVEWPFFIEGNARSIAPVLACRALQFPLVGFLKHTVRDLSAGFGSPLTGGISLSSLCALLQLPSKAELDQLAILDKAGKGRLAEVFVANEQRAISVYQLYLREQLLLGNLTEPIYANELVLLRAAIQ